MEANSRLGQSQFCFHLRDNIFPFITCGLVWTAPLIRWLSHPWPITSGSACSCLPTCCWRTWRWSGSAFSWPLLSTPARAQRTPRYVGYCHIKGKIQVMTSWGTARCQRPAVLTQAVGLTGRCLEVIAAACEKDCELWLDSITGHWVWVMRPKKGWTGSNSCGIQNCYYHGKKKTQWLKNPELQRSSV